MPLRLLSELTCKLCLKAGILSTTCNLGFFYMCRNRYICPSSFMPEMKSLEETTNDDIYSTKMHQKAPFKLQTKKMF